MAIGEPVTQDALDAAMADMAEAVNNLEAVEGAFEMGDVNHSGIVDIDDATLIQMHLAKALGNTAFYKENADYSKDGKITVYDATLIQLMPAFIIDYYPLLNNPKKWPLLRKRSFCIYMELSA